MTIEAEETIPHRSQGMCCRGRCEDEIFNVLASDEILVKWLLLETEDAVIPGFQEENWKKALEV